MPHAIVLNYVSQLFGRKLRCAEISLKKPLKHFFDQIILPIRTQIFRKGLTVVPGGHMSVILVIIIGFRQWGVRKDQNMAQNGPRVYTCIKIFLLRSPLEAPK